MNVVDSSGWLEYFVDGPNADFFAPAVENPAELVARLARQKAANVARRVERGWILGCDTVAECGGEILGKPADEQAARRMLETLRGRRHRVFSGLCLWRQPAGNRC